jgi:hypothetical protein
MLFISRLHSANVGSVGNAAIFKTFSIKKNIPMRERTYSMSEVKATQGRSLLNIYSKWLESRGHSKLSISQAFSKYHVGVSKDQIIPGNNCQHSPLFWRITRDYEVIGMRSLRVKMGNGYSFDGVYAKPEFGHLVSYPLYGDHLLSEHPSKPVKIYENEMEAIEASIIQPDFNCLAFAGGAEPMEYVRGLSEWTLPGSKWEVSREDICRLFNQYVKDGLIRAAPLPLQWLKNQRH